jgi:hypothetical protein
MCLSAIYGPLLNVYFKSFRRITYVNMRLLERLCLLSLMLLIVFESKSPVSTTKVLTIEGLDLDNTIVQCLETGRTEHLANEFNVIVFVTF